MRFVLTLFTYCQVAIHVQYSDHYYRDDSGLSGGGRKYIIMRCQSFFIFAVANTDENHDASCCATSTSMILLCMYPAVVPYVSGSFRTAYILVTGYTIPGTRLPFCLPGAYTTSTKHDTKA